MKQQSRKMGRTALLIVLGGVFVLSLIIIGALTSANRSQPSGAEYAVANELVHRLMANQQTTEKQQIYFEVSRNTVSVNVYGAIQESSQQQLEIALRKILRERPNSLKVKLVFFPQRNSSSEVLPNGVTVKSIEQQSPIRVVSIQ